MLIGLDCLWNILTETVFVCLLSVYLSLYLSIFLSLFFSVSAIVFIGMTVQYNITQALKQ